MACSKCNQEHDDNLDCPKVPPEPEVIDQNNGEKAEHKKTPAPDDDREKQKPNAPKGPGVHVDGESSVNAGRDINFFLNAINKDDQPHKGEEEKSLWEFVKPLSPRSVRHYRSSEADLQDMVVSLARDHVILLSSSYDEYAVDTAWEVIEAMPDSSDRFNGSLAFEDTVGKTSQFSPQKLWEQRPEAEAEAEIVLLVDALDSQANTFPASILGRYTRFETAKQDLKNSKLFLVIVVNHDYAIEKNLSQQNRSYKGFSYWNIPFLEPFFQRKFENHEELLAEIAKQRANGKWEEDDSIFTQQIINYYHSDRLLEVISNGGPVDPDTFAESMLKDAGPVERTVLYTATFFDEITSPEFCRVVESLLGTRTTLKDAPNISANGATSATTQVEVPLRRIWDDGKDEIFTKLLVETSTGNDSPLTVSLSEVNLAEPLRKLFEKCHRFYLLDQFKALQNTGIFFYPSLRLAKKTTELAVDLARLYPDEFNEGWIVTLVMRIREYFATHDSDEERTEDPMFNFLSNTQPHAFQLAFSRVSEVCQGFLEIPQQKSVVPNSLEYLINNKYQQEVLWLIKQLKFNPEFDDWYWLKQLLNRGDLGTQYLTYSYVLSYLKQLGTRVYDGLKKIEAWLPPTDRANFSDFDTFVFRILIKYCLDTINRFKDKHYGKWPSRYALFASTDLETAKSRVALLAHCLLHPGVDHTLVGLKIGNTRMTLIAILLAEWSFILLGGPAGPQTPARKEQKPGEVEECTASEMFDLLLKEFFGGLDLQQRLELLQHWTELDSFLLVHGNSYELTAALRDELKWKRPLVRRLIRELKLTPAAKPTTAKSPLPVVTSSQA